MCCVPLQGLKAVADPFPLGTLVLLEGYIFFLRRIVYKNNAITHK